jgi:hypothetical protein
MRILFTGDRNYTDGTFVADTLAELERLCGQPSEVFIAIVGRARGLDTLAEHHATLRGWQIEPYPADWAQYGRAAGPIRNQQMLDARPACCLAFHDNFESSRGTLDMVNRCRKIGLPTALYGHRQLLKQWNWGTNA